MTIAMPILILSFVITLLMAIFACKVCCKTRIVRGQMKNECMWTCKKEKPLFEQSNSVYF